MSMISSLIDDLRQMADGQATFHDAREVMLEAADTIWQLRDDLQRANAENAKLRELVRDMWHWIEDSNACDVNEHGEAMNCAYCGHYGTVRKGLISCKLYERMRELEVEVSK